MTNNGVADTKFKVMPGVVVLNRFTLEKPIGFGGTAAVWLGQEDATGQQVAIKIQNAGENVGAHRFERLDREGQLLKLIDSPYVMKCRDSGRLPDGRACLIFEHLRGQSLREVLEAREMLPLGEALTLISQLLRALDASHRLGIIHRDLKPDNIMILDAPEGGVRVKLFDYGIAKMLEAPDGSVAGRNDPELAELLMPLTAAEMTVGTPEYMAPEQISATDLGHFTDVYAAGVVFYEMLFGEVPYTGKSFFEIAHRHLAGLLPPLPADLPESVQGLIWRSLACSPDQRYPNVVDMLADISQIIVSGQASDYDAQVHGPLDLDGLFSDPPSPFDAEEVLSLELVKVEAEEDNADLSPWGSTVVPESVMSAEEWLRNISLDDQKVALAALDNQTVLPEMSTPSAAHIIPGVRVRATDLMNSARIGRSAREAADASTTEMSALDRKALEEDRVRAKRRPVVIRRTDGQVTGVYQRTRAAS